MLGIPAGALEREVLLTIEPLSGEQLADLDSGMDNVTAPHAGYRFGPHGLRYTSPILIALPYDPELIPNGLSPENIRTFYFNEATEGWIALELITVDQERRMVISSTDHFTDFVNATLILPDHPEPTAFDPNTMTRIPAPDPAARINLIERPGAESSGDARLAVPIELPPGRLGMAPDLTLRYSNSAQNGWCGWGWNLDAPFIEVDTRFGVARFRHNVETESYLLNGQQLAPLANRQAPEPRQAERTFVRRVEGSFHRIVRRGDAPDNYWWEVTDQRGTRFEYGKTAAARLQSYGTPADVFRWLLERVIDTHGNTVEYRYTHDDLAGNGEPSTQVYLAGVDYTGKDGGPAPRYHVDFVLDDGTRPDRIVTGRPGFKALTRFRLKQIEVRLDATLIRRYDLLYRTGNFSKSLLEDLVVVGEDGATEFYRHTFKYFEMPTNPDNSYAGFGDEEVWGAVSNGDTMAKLEGDSFHASLFLGIGPVDCQNHFGPTFGFGEGTTETQLVLRDLDGDGLVERYRATGATEYNVLSGDHESGGFVSGVNFGDPGILEQDESTTLSFALGLHLIGEQASVSSDWTWTNADQTRRIVDIDGNGFPDLVSLENGLQVRLNDGTGFSAPQAFQGFVTDDLDLSDPEEVNDIQAEFHATDTLVRWVAPYDGTVEISGAVTKVTSGGDGLDAFIYEGDIELWTGHVSEMTGSTADPGVIVATPSAGDRFYFRLTSGDDTAQDVVTWQPHIEYTAADCSPGLGALEPFGAKVCVFDHGDDFRLAGPPDLTWVATAEGTVEISGTVAKQPTADGAHVEIRHNGTVICSKDYSADDDIIDSFDTLSCPAELQVQPDDTLAFIVTADTPIDPRRVLMTPSVLYVEYCRSPGVCGAPECGYDPDHPNNCRLLGEGDDVVPIQLMEIEQQGPVQAPVFSFDPHTPTETWIAPMDGTIEVAGSMTRDNPTAGDVIALVQGVNLLHGKMTVSPPDPGGPFNVADIEVTSGDHLFFMIYAVDSNDDASTAFNWKPVIQYTSPAGPPLPRPPVNSRTVAPAPASQRFSGGYHGFAAGQWNGNLTFDESCFDNPPLPPPPPSPPTCHTGFVAMQPDRDGLPGVAGPLWTGPSGQSYIKADHMRPSRVGGNPLAIALGTGLVTMRSTKARNASISGSVFGFSASYNTAVSKTRLDLIDINGDNFVDQVSPGKVRFNTGFGGFGPLENVDMIGSVVRRIESQNVAFTGGLGTLINIISSSGWTRALAAFLPTMGESYGTSHAFVDLFDVNADGLPDRVSMDPGDNAMTVRLNLGYRFGMPEQWSMPDSGVAPLTCGGDLGGHDFGLTPGDPRTLRLNDTGADLESGDPSVGRTLVSFVDVNLDGLLDRVIKKTDEQAFRVSINRGAGFDSESSWMPERLWTVSNWIVDSDTEDDFCGNHALETGLSTGTSSNFGHEFKIPIPIAGICIVIGPNFNQSTVNTGAELVFTDIDGDSAVDAVLKRDGQTEVYVKRNKVGKTNLLREVIRPLGGSFTLDYRRQGNLVDYPVGGPNVDMPTNRWVLAEVNLDDGRGNTYLTEFEHFDSGFRDRTEREDYGFAHVRETRPDGSTVDRHFHNQDLYRKGLLFKTIIADSSGKLFRKETVNYEVRPIKPDSFFPAAVSTGTFFYEGTTTDENSFGKAMTESVDFDGFGNPITFLQEHDAGSADDIEGIIEYHQDLPAYIIRPSHLQANDATGDPLRESFASYDSAGNLTSLQRVLIGGNDPASGDPYTGATNPLYTMTYDAFGNLSTLTDPSGYTLTYTYDPGVQTFVSGIGDSFGYSSSGTYDLRWGAAATTTDTNGQTTSRTYDQFGRLIEAFSPYDDASSPTPSLSFEYHPEASPSSSITHQKDVTRPDPITAVTFIDGLGREIQSKTDAELDDGASDTGPIGMIVSGRRVLDEKGRVSQSGQPMFSTAPAADFVDMPLQIPILFTYDILDRIVSLTRPDNSVVSRTHGFDQLDGITRFVTTVTDQENHSKRLFRSVRNELLAVEEQNTIGGVPTTLVTRYSYDALSRLIEVTDAAGDMTTLAYDTLGHRISLVNPDSGSTRWRYDLAGNLGAKITSNLAAQGQQIGYLYTYNRLDRIEYPETPDVLYSYGLPGAPFNGAGRIVTLTNESGTEDRFYGRLGEVTRTIHEMASHTPTQPGEIYSTEYTYDSFNRLLQLNYHDGEELTYVYDAGGRVKAVSGVKNGVTYDYVLHLGYDEFNDKARIVYGNGVETRFSYDPLTRRLSNLNSENPAGLHFQNINYTYDLVGNPLQLHNDVPIPNPPIFGGPTQQTFTYDELYQLVSASGTYQFQPDKSSVYTLSMAYDQSGNIIAKNQTHDIIQPGSSVIPQRETTYDLTYLHGGPRPHAVTHVDDRTFSYDANGNQTGWEHDFNGTQRQILWDEENRIKSISDNGRTTTFLYNPDGIRTHKIGAQGETIYVNRFFTVRNREIVSKHFFAGDTRICTKIGRPALGPGGGNPGGQGPPHGGHPREDKLYFYHRDHLGSSNHVTDQEAELFQHFEYFPSGEMWVQEKSNTQLTPFLFSAVELDEETGLYAFPLRYYDARLGRWQSTDPILTLQATGTSGVLDNNQWLGVPGNWNLYGYALNNPLVFIDPTGAQAYEASEGVGTGFLEGFGLGLGVQIVSVYGSAALVQEAGLSEETANLVVGGTLLLGDIVLKTIKASEVEDRNFFGDVGLAIIASALDNLGPILKAVAVDEDSGLGQLLDYLPSALVVTELSTGQDFLTGKTLTNKDMNKRRGKLFGSYTAAFGVDIIEVSGGWPRLFGLDPL